MGHKGGELEVRRLMLFIVGGAVLVSGSAFANGPSGSTETSNNVQCAQGTNVNGNIFYVGSNGFEWCTDGKAPGNQTRTIVTTDQGGYVVVDGDKDNANPAPRINSRSDYRVDRTGVHCGNATNQDGTKPDQSQNNSSTCIS